MSAASSSAIHRRAAGEVTSLASITRLTPKARATASCAGVATVMAQAPAFSCLAQRAGAIVVLPCGAISSPRSAAQRDMVAMFEATAGSKRVSSGVESSDSRGAAVTSSATVSYTHLTLPTNREV